MERVREVDSKAVAVVGTRSASRTVAMATLLRDCIARHGWSARLHVIVGGVGCGAGAADRADIGMLARDGHDPIADSCSDVSENQRVIAAADCLVVANAGDAELLLEWPEADGKHVLAFSDYLGKAAWALESVEAGFRDFVDEVEEATPSLVRALVAWPGC